MDQPTMYMVRINCIDSKCHHNAPWLDTPGRVLVSMTPNVAGARAIARQHTRDTFHAYTAEIFDPQGHPITLG